jgi:predicted metal-binding membrane protein
VAVDAAAMMLPGAVPAVLGRATERALAVPQFVGPYLAAWTLVGIAVYGLYRPHGTSAAGALTLAAGVYELTPLKRHFRRRCRESVRSGFQFGLYSVGSSIGLMVMLLALGVMSVTWMAVVALLVSPRSCCRQQPLSTRRGRWRSSPLGSSSPSRRPRSQVSHRRCSERREEK